MKAPNTLPSHTEWFDQFCGKKAEVRAAHRHNGHACVGKFCQESRLLHCAGSGGGTHVKTRFEVRESKIGYGASKT